MLFLLLSMALAEPPAFEAPKPLFAPSAAMLPIPAKAPPTELVFCFSPEVKLKFGAGSRHVELYPAAKRAFADWQDIEPPGRNLFNPGGAQLEAP